MEKTIQVGLARKERHTAKTMDVAKVELLVRLVQVRHYMSMGRQRLPGLNNHKLARHPQVEDQMKTFFQPKHDPFSSPDNRFIFFVSNRTGEAQVWRMNADGSNQTQITFKEGGSPIFVSLDGRWVYYQHALQSMLWRASTEGGEEQIVLNKERYSFAFSPDGARVAFSERRVGETSIVIV